MGLYDSTDDHYDALEDQADEPWKDESLLRHRYGEGKSAADLGGRWGVTRQAVDYWMEEFGIDKRGPSEAAEAAADEAGGQLRPEESY